jgi:hypothetical protein
MFFFQAPLFKLHGKRLTVTSTEVPFAFLEKPVRIIGFDTV